MYQHQTVFKIISDITLMILSSQLSQSSTNVIFQPTALSLL